MSEKCPDCGEDHNSVILLGRNMFGHWLKDPQALRLASEPETDTRRLKNRLMVAYIAGFTAGWINAKNKPNPPSTP